MSIIFYLGPSQRSMMEFFCEKKVNGFLADLFLRKSSIINVLEGFYKAPFFIRHRDGSAVEIVGLCKSALRWLNNLFDQGVYKYNNVVKCIEGKSFGFITLRQRCPNTELFLVLIFPHSD